MPEQPAGAAYQSGGSLRAPPGTIRCPSIVSSTWNGTPPRRVWVGRPPRGGMGAAVWSGGMP